MLVDFNPIKDDDSKICALWQLNKRQHIYKNQIELYIECETDTIHFYYNKLYFSFDIPVDLNKIGDFITKSLMGKIMSFSIVYFTAMNILSEKLNPFDIGIVLNKNIEDILDKKIEEKLLLNSYSIFCKTNNNISIKEFENNVWNS